MSLTINLNGVQYGHPDELFFICGPCQIEGYDHALMVAEKLADIALKQSVKMIYKSSFDKANRSSVGSQRGVGLQEGLKILDAVKSTFGFSILTDVHDANQCSVVAEVADVLQIPAFLCRQTDLLLAAGSSGRAVNIKKGQFLDPYAMRYCAEKIVSTGNSNIMLCERGTTFGYNALINDFRSIPIMSELGFPVVFDATHSVQQPGAAGSSSGGDRRFVHPLARAAVAVGAHGIFIETHESPDNAPSDGPNMIPLDRIAQLIKDLQVIKGVC